MISAPPQSTLTPLLVRSKKLNADVLNLVETQDCYVLGQLMKAIGDSTYKAYLVKGTDTTTNQNVALLTRIDPVVDLQRYQPSGSDVRVSIPVSGSKCGSTASDTTAVSKHYYTKIVVDSTDILLIGAHFVAFPTLPDRCAQREGQAQIIAQIIQKEGIAKGNEVIFFGDLNDFDDVIPYVDSNVPKSMVLKTLKATGVSSVMTKADVSTRYSVWYDSNNDCVVRVPQEVSVIDHVLVTPQLYSKVSDVQYRHDLYTKTCTNYESDHWPVTFSLSSSGSNGNSTSSSGKSHKGVIIAVVVVLIVVLVLAGIGVAIFLYMRKQKSRTGTYSLSLS